MTGPAPSGFALPRAIAARRQQHAPLPPPPQASGLSAVRPVGCELLVRNVAPLSDRNAAQIVQAALDDILKRADEEHGPFHLVPVSASLASANRSKSNDLAVSSVLVKINKTELEKRDASVARFAATRSDLLEAWVQPLAAVDPSWEVLPAPAPEGRDKRCWVLAAASDDADRLLREIKAELSKRGIPVVHDFEMRNHAIVIILRSPETADELRRTGLKTASRPDGVRLQAANQIDPIHIFETVIRYAGDLDFQSQESILSFLEHAYRAPDLPADQSCILESRTVGEDLCVTFRDWDTTARALTDREGFLSFCAGARGIEPPALIYDVNSPGFGPRSRTVASRLDAAASSMGGALEGLHAEISSMKKQMIAQQSAAQEQFAELRKANTNLAATMMQIEAMTKTSMLLTATTAEAFVARGRADLLERKRSELRQDIEDEADPATKAELKAELQRVLAELKEARGSALSLESSQLELLPTLKLAITGPPAAPPAPPAASTSTAPSTPASRKRNQPDSLPTPSPSPTKPRTSEAAAMPFATPIPPPNFAATRQNDSMDLDDGGGL